MEKGSRLHTTQHLGEYPVQTAQTALKGDFALAVLLDGRLAVDVRCEVRERDLLREEQQEDAG